MKYRVDISHGVKVGAHHFPIRVGKGITERLQEGGYYGRCYHTKKEVLVDGTLPESKFNETVVHEIIEVVNEVYCNAKVAHRHIANMANGLTQALGSLGVTFEHRGREHAGKK